jgi:acylphosphatase
MNENLQTVVNSVNKILNDTNQSSITENVVERLVSFGYVPTDADSWVIAYSIKGTVNHVLNEINRLTVPEGLTEVVVDMICGEVLNAKFLSGQLEMDSLDLDGMIQSVKEGDTQVNFSAEGSDEAKLKNLLSWLMQGKGCDLLCYRKMRW